ncbi:MAG TPA: peptidase M28, partial [Thermoanaerobaculia bacterium]
MGSLGIVLGAGLLAAALPAVLTGAEKGPAPAAVQLPAGAEAAAKAIDRASLEAPIRFLADDLQEGRGPASHGDETAQLYLASTLESLGYQPALPKGEWQQNFEIVGIKSDMPKSWTFKAGDQTVALKWWDDYIGASGVQAPTSSIKDAELVFVGYGIQAPEYQWDDFKGVDLKGKILVMMNNDPDSDPKLFEGNRRLYY